jgi:hypothetical protein
VTQTGQIVGYIAGALTFYAGMPSWISLVMNLPDTVLGIRDLIGKLSMASQIQNALRGVPSPVEEKIIAQATGETKSPTGTAGVAVGGASGVPWLLLAGAAVALLS